MVPCLARYYFTFSLQPAIFAFREKVPGSMVTYRLLCTVHETRRICQGRRIKSIQGLVRRFGFSGGREGRSRSAEIGVGKYLQCQRHWQDYRMPDRLGTGIQDLSWPRWSGTDPIVGRRYQEAPRQGYRTRGNIICGVQGPESRGWER